MVNESEQADQLRRMIDEALLAGHEDYVHNLFNGG